ncbi:hypothetical protein HHK36_024353 [Tetracentron sinense]|uniref:SURP motif domain-containing protein n=1 Tax=Tetracentron sinense TaxID=13715 RepID=A0A834YIT8_TETSI|nr:hypothetical protein HHK36_024353 [Tetracentron sinense]
MDADDDDFVFYGTPIEREEEMTGRKKKAVAEAAGHLRSLPPWKQEVTDEEGRRRFHGAFTGGFSAGYYNSVGSKEGWTPQTFTSSRKNRAEMKQQSILNFLDDDERAEMEGNSLRTSLQFDTFGFTATELARKEAEKEQQKRPSAIPGPVPDEIVLPATDSIGVKLLLKMGWRHGHSIKDSRTNSLYDARREARKAFLALSTDDARALHAQSEPVKSHLESVSEQSAEDDAYASQSTPVYVLNPKQDLHGLGYDPFKQAPEFRGNGLFHFAEKKRLRVSGNREPGNRKSNLNKDNLFSFKSGKAAPGFGIGALEELDAEDEDIYASGLDFEETYVQEVEEPSGMSRDSKQKLVKNEQGVLPGFKNASNSDYQLERFNPPVIPVDFKPYHKFCAPLEIESKLASPAPPEVPPPDDSNLRVLIEGIATLVARCGTLFEDLSREKNKANPLFCFLNGGNGHDYYTRKLWEERQKHNGHRKLQVDMKLIPNVQKMTAESRGKILGERPLERSSTNSGSSAAPADVIHLQFNLSDTFTIPASLGDFPRVAKPFRDDPAKQERFELFLKEKYQGGLRSTDSGGASNMSESARARERLDFEAAAETIAKGELNKETEPHSSQQFREISATANMHFTPGGLEQVKIPEGEELIMKKIYPKREEFQWRPSPILCKRFDIMDPYMGKPPPLPRVRGRIDSLIFTPDFVRPTKAEETVAANKNPLPVSQSEPQEISEEMTSREIEIELKNTNVERPVDLYKLCTFTEAIFSDDSDDERENSSLNEVEDPQKKTEVANTTLNRLIAGDFLESLGKELGLEVPPDLSYSLNKASTPPFQNETETIRTSKGDVNNFSFDEKSSSTHKAVIGTFRGQETAYGKLSHPEITREAASDGSELASGNKESSGSKTATGHSENNSGKVKLEKIAPEDKKTKPYSRWSRSSTESSEDERRRHSRRHRSHSSSIPLEDERSRKHSRRHQSGSCNSDSDYSDEHGSRSKGGKKGSSRRKSSREHSKHHKHGSKDYPSKSSRHDTRREHSEAKKESRKSRDRGREPVSSKAGSYKNNR